MSLRETKLLIFKSAVGHTHFSVVPRIKIALAAATIVVTQAPGHSHKSVSEETGERGTLLLTVISRILPPVGLDLLQ